LQVKL